MEDGDNETGHEQEGSSRKITELIEKVKELEKEVGFREEEI